MIHSLALIIVLTFPCKNCKKNLKEHSLQILIKFFPIFQKHLAKSSLVRVAGVVMEIKKYFT
jgi:hypothetical protein